MSESKAYLDTLRVIDEELRQVEQRRADLLAARQVVHGFTVGPALTVKNINEAVYAAGEPPMMRVGPKEAVLLALSEFGRPASRREIVARALDWVKTPPNTAKKVLDQTIRNLTNKRIAIDPATGDLSLIK